MALQAAAPPPFCACFTSRPKKIIIIFKSPPPTVFGARLSATQKATNLHAASLGRYGSCLPATASKTIDHPPLPPNDTRYSSTSIQANHPLLCSAASHQADNPAQCVLLLRVSESSQSVSLVAGGQCRLQFFTSYTQPNPPGLLFYV